MDKLQDIRRQLGPVELGGWDSMFTRTNPPLSRRADEVRPHADYAVFQALASPCLEIRHTAVTALGPDTWRVEVGIANTGWLPTDVSVLARKQRMVRPLTARLDGGDVVGGPATIELGQLEGGSSARFRDRHDGTPDRVLASWVVRAAPGTELIVTVEHPRAGRVTTTLTPA